MELQDVQKDTKERKTKIISVRTFPTYSKWLAENKVSPTKLFNLAVEELMKKK